MDCSRRQPAARLRPRGALFAFHVTLNTWAYAAFALSFVLSLVYLVQDWLLRSRQLGSGVLALSGAWTCWTAWRAAAFMLGWWRSAFGVAMGLVWAHRLSGTYPLGDPKVMVTLAILVVYIAYLRLSRSATWRGARAALLCALNFLMVLFSYTFVNLYLTRFHRFF